MKESPINPESAASQRTEGSSPATGSAESRKRYRVTPDDDATRSVECEQPLVVMVLAERFAMCAKKVLIEEIPRNND